LLPFSFAGKVVIGLIVLSGFIVLALLRVGPDRIPFEEWLRRRVRFRLQARRYTYQQRGYEDVPQKRPWPYWGGGWKYPQWGFREPEPRPDVSEVSQFPTSAGGLRPVGLALSDIGVYPLVSVLLAVLGTYLIGWLWQGGVDELARLIGGALR
jgi:hypothetical protein